MRLKPATRVRPQVLVLCCITEPKVVVLRVDPKDEDALQTKLFLLLQTEQYIQALTLISNVNDQNEQKEEEGAFFFEKGYTLHRLHREEDATEVLKVLKEGGSEDENRGVAHLEAQLVRDSHLYICRSELVKCRLTVKETIKPLTTCTTRFSTQLSR